MASLLTISTIGLTCKTFLNSGLASITVNGLPTLIDALDNAQRNNGQGIITVANHISTLDDPVTWGVLPLRSFFNPRRMRWALGASDIMFTNPLFSSFFRQGQVLETFRGKGIYQPAVDSAIEKLNQGLWVHLFGEGKINQPDTYVQQNGVAHLPRFKWGVGRVVMEAAIPPVIIPMWLSGFDKLMPEGRPFPYNYLPRLGVDLSVTFGHPILADEIKAALTVLGADRKATGSEGIVPRGLEKERLDGWIGEEVAHEMPRNMNEEETIKWKQVQTMKVRIEVTSIVQNAVEALGRSVSGNLLSGTRT